MLALAGRGSSRFGGGGSGGGFGGGRRGSGGGGFPLILPIGGGGGVLLLILLLVVAAVVLPLVIKRYNDWSRRQRASSEAAARNETVRRAAIEASDDDEAFDPDTLVANGRGLFVAVQDAWNDQDSSALSRMLGPELFAEWERRLRDFRSRGLTSHARVIGDPKVDLVSIVNRADDSDDRVVLFITANMESWVENAHGERGYVDGRTGPSLVVQQYWTLTKRDGRWVLMSIEEEAEGRHHLSSQVIAAPEHDPRIAEEARTSLAADDATDSDTAALASTSFDDDARAAALDLSLVDDRFSPDVLEIAARQAVEAWTVAIDGPDAPLERIASREAVDRLLYEGSSDHSVRTVVRGPQVSEVRIEAIDGQAVPPTMTVAIRYSGAWYRENRDTQALIAGSRERRSERTAHWTLSLTNVPATPWRLTRVGDGAIERR